MKALLVWCCPLWLFAAQTVSVFKVPKMHCPMCTVAVKKSVASLLGVTKVQVRLNTKTAKIWHDERIDDARLIEAIGRTGYTAEVLYSSAEPK